MNIIDLKLRKIWSKIRKRGNNFQLMIFILKIQLLLYVARIVQFFYEFQILTHTTV